MPFLTCKACGAEAVTPVEMSVEDSDGFFADADEAHFYTCQVCGDNWLSIKRVPLGEAPEITFVHQMGLQPQLKRTARMANAIVLNESSVDDWSYFLGDDEVDEDAWRDRLTERRRVLKSVCTN